MSNFYTPSQTSFALKSRKLIVPIVSVANLGQLAADLLICSLRLERIGFLDDALLVPAVGGRDSDENNVSGESGELRGGISTPLEGFFFNDYLGKVINEETQFLEGVIWML